MTNDLKMASQCGNNISIFELLWSNWAVNFPKSYYCWNASNAPKMLSQYGIWVVEMNYHQTIRRVREREFKFRQTEWRNAIRALILWYIWHTQEIDTHMCTRAHWIQYMNWWWWCNLKWSSNIPVVNYPIVNVSLNSESNHKLRKIGTKVERFHCFDIKDNSALFSKIKKSDGKFESDITIKENVHHRILIQF